MMKIRDFGRPAFSAAEVSTSFTNFSLSYVGKTLGMTP